MTCTAHTSNGFFGSQITEVLGECANVFLVSIVSHDSWCVVDTHNWRSNVDLKWDMLQLSACRKTVNSGRTSSFSRGEKVDGLAGCVYRIL